MSENSLEQLKLNFVKNVGHELSTSVSIIQSYMELLQDGYLEPLAPKQRETIANLAERTSKLKKMVDQLHPLLVIEVQKSVQKPVNLAQIMTKAVKRYQSKAAQAGVTITFCPTANLPLVWGSWLLLLEAMSCLIENALKFTPPGGGVTLSVTPEAEWVRLTISDTGIGLAEDALNYLLDTSFYQADDSLAPRYEGIGLGLTVVKAVVEAHAGQIEVKSQPSQGSQFTLRLPILSSASGAEQVTENRPKPARILIVDDEENITLTLQIGLRKMNYEIITTNSGQKALQFVKQQSFDLLITDYLMPDVDGLTLATYTRQRHPETVVMMITAHRNEELLEHADRTLIQYILDKPVNLNAVRQMVTKILGDQ